MARQEAKREHAKAREDEEDMQPGASVQEVPASMLPLALRLVTDLAVGEDLHVEVSSSDAHCQHMDLVPRLLEHVREQVPVRLCQGSHLQVILCSSPGYQQSAAKEGRKGEDVTRPSILSVDDHKDGNQECQLHICGDCPAPEEASIDRGLEVRNNIPNEK